MNIAILGAGMVGRTIAADLARNHKVTSFDRSAESLAILNQINGHISCIEADLDNFDHYGAMLAGFDFVVTALPGFMGYSALEAVIKAGKSVADISFFPEDALQLDELARQMGVTAIVDCGVAPGMSNYMLGYHNEHMKINAFSCMVGGLPVHRVKPFEYKAPFSPIDVIEEYTRPARMKENGHIVIRPALSEPELVDFPGIGTLESFNTDGLRSLLYTLPHIPDMKERTLRYPGHISFIQALMKGGFFKTGTVKVKGVEIVPLEVSAAILMDQWRLQPGEPEFTLMQIRIEGTVDGAAKTIVYDLYDTNDTVTGFSSMSRTTGFTCAASLELIMQGKFDKKGVFPPELVGSMPGCFEDVMHYLAARNVIYRKTEIEQTISNRYKG